MRESFIFYKSFYDAIEFLGEKAQLKLYKSIMKLNFNCAENETDLIQLCDEIETELKQNRQAFAQFLLIKPQLFANYKKYLNGCKGKDSGCLGAEYGKLGGRPKKTPQNPPNENENENVNVNEEGKCKKVPSSSSSEIPNQNSFYGEYSNVYLDKKDYGKIFNECLNEKYLNELIEELSEKIAKGDPRCPVYNEDFPHAHFLILKAFHKFRKENTHKFKKESNHRETEKRLDSLIDEQIKKLQREQLNE